MKHFKSILIGALCISCLSLLIGCNDYEGYTGDYPWLFSVAVESIPNARGAIIYEVTSEPVVQYLEEDEYGRVLYCYSEEYGNYEDGRNHGQASCGGVNLVICQGYDEKYAYYYAKCNYISAPLCKGNKINIFGNVKPPEIKYPYNNFTEADIANLKNDNDWGKELNMKKCNKTLIIRKVKK